MPMVRPKPRQVSHAPSGELNENRLGAGCAVGEVALRAVQLARITPGVQALRRIGRIDALHVDAAAADAQRRLERLEHAAALGAAGTQPVLHYLQRDRRRGCRAAAALLAARRR